MARLKPFVPWIVVMALALLPFMFSEQTTHFWQGVLIQIYVLAVYALSYDLLMGYTGIISFGYALFVGADACTSIGWGAKDALGNYLIQRQSRAFTRDHLGTIR